jgi:hypothetical protein
VPRFPSDTAATIEAVLRLVPPPGSAPASPPRSPREQLLILEDRKLALLARGVGDHLPIELVERMLALRAERVALEASLGLDAGLEVHARADEGSR